MHQDDRQPTNARFVTLLYLCGLTFILYLDRMCIGKAAPFIQSELNLSTWQMGWVQAAFTIAYGLFEIPTGHLGDKYGSRSVLIRIVLWWSLFTALTGAAFGLWTLLVVRFLFGAGEAGALPNATRVVDRWFPKESRGRIRGIVHTPALIGGVVAPVFTALLIERFGWRSVFVLFGSLGVFWAIGFANWFRDDPSDHPLVNEEERELIGAPPKHEQVDHLPLGTIAQSPDVWLLSVVLMSGSATVYMLFSWYPSYLEKVFGVSNIVSGALNSAVMLGGALGCAIGGWVVDRAGKIVSERWKFSVVGTSGFAAASVCVALSALSPDPYLKSALLSLGCFGIHLHAGAWWGANSAIGGKHMGATFAMINSMGVFGAALAQLGFGYLPPERWTLAFVAAGAFLAIGAICWSQVDPRRKVFDQL